MLVRTLAELGVTFPFLLGQRLHEVMARLLSLCAGAAKVDNLRVALGKALSSACIALAFTIDIQLEEFSSCFMRKLWWLEMVNFIEVLEDIGCFGFWGVSILVHVNLERIWH